MSIMNTPMPRPKSKQEQAGNHFYRAEALLEQAEITAQSGNRKVAGRQLQAFLSAWTTGGLPDGLRRRVAMLQSELAG